MAARVSASIFPMLGVEPILGRTLTPEEDVPGHSVVLLDYGLWQRRFGGDKDIVGRAIELDRQTYTIVGVMPRDFAFPIRGSVSSIPDLSNMQRRYGCRWLLRAMRCRAGATRTTIACWRG